jgi:very-short-patch-repair endonuclease
VTIRLTEKQAARILPRGKRGAPRRKRTDLGAVLEEQLRLARMEGFVRELRFHPIRRWRLDLAWPDIKLAVECEGLSRRGVGYHQSPAGVAGDCEKHSALAAMGWRLLRVTAEQIRRGHALNWIDAAMTGAIGDTFDAEWDPAAKAQRTRKRKRLAERD